MNFTRTKTFTSLAILAALPLLSGCERVLYMEIEQPEICQTLPDQAYEGNQYSNELTIDIQGQMPGIDLSEPHGIETLFRLSKVEFIAKSGITDFDFVSGANISLIPPDGSTKPPATVIDYTRSGPTGATLSMVGATDVDLYDYLKEGDIVVASSLTGTLPSNAWSMDLRVCMYVRIRADYLKLGEVFLDTTEPEADPDPAP